MPIPRGNDIDGAVDDFIRGFVAEIPNVGARYALQILTREFTSFAVDRQLVGTDPRGIPAVVAGHIIGRRQTPFVFFSVQQECKILHLD